MSVPSDRPPVELLSLRSATTTYLAMLDDIDHWAEQVSDVNRFANPSFADGLDKLRGDLKSARQQHRIGTPASISRSIAELLGEG
jgi:hypothetical protein